jgi:hypothetical protein
MTTSIPVRPIAPISTSATVVDSTGCCCETWTMIASGCCVISMYRW